jgi:histidine phosphotransfer protein HptB
MYHISMTFDQALIALNINREETLRRFSGNMELMKHFILQFPQDKTFDQFQKAYKEENWKDVENAVHTLKGISGNLGFTAMYGLTTTLVTHIRAGDYEEAKKFAAELTDCCKNVIKIIGQIS